MAEKTSNTRAAVMDRASRQYDAMASRISNQRVSLSNLMGILKRAETLCTCGAVTLVQKEAREEADSGSPEVPLDAS